MARPCTNLKHGFHDIHTIQNDDYGVWEICNWCRKEIKIRKGPQGRLLDNEAYIEFHAHDFLQSGTQAFEDYYGKEKTQENREFREKEQKNKDKKKKTEEIGTEYKEHKAKKEAGTVNIAT